MSRIARMFIRRVGAPMFAVPALVVGAEPASADGYARFDDAVVTVSPDCTGTVRAEAAVAPLQIGDRIENGVRVSVQFAADNHDSSCFVVASVSWHNLDTGATGPTSSLAAGPSSSRSARTRTRAKCRSPYRRLAGVLAFVVTGSTHTSRSRHQLMTTVTGVVLRWRTIAGPGGRTTPS